MTTVPKDNSLLLKPSIKAMLVDDSYIECLIFVILILCLFGFLTLSYYILKVIVLLYFVISNLTWGGFFLLLFTIAYFSTSVFKRKKKLQNVNDVKLILQYYRQYTNTYFLYLFYVIRRGVKRYYAKESTNSIYDDYFSFKPPKQSNPWREFIRSIALRNPSLRNTLLALQCCDKKNQRVFGVRGFGNSLSFIVTSREALQLFVDLCGNYKRYTPFHIDVKFLMGFYFVITVGAKNIFLHDERSTCFIYMICGTHSHEDFFSLFNFIHTKVQKLSKLKVGVADLEKAIYNGIEKFNRSNNCSISLVACWFHFKRCVRMWLDSPKNKGLYSEAEAKFFWDTLFGEQSIYRGDSDLYFYELDLKIDRFGKRIKSYFMKEHNGRFENYIKANKEVHGLNLEITNNLIESLHHIMSILKAEKNQSVLKTTRQFSTKISSDINDWKRIVLGGGNGKIKKEFSNIETKYRKLYSYGTGGFPNLKFDFESYEFKKCYENLFEEVKIFYEHLKFDEDIFRELSKLCAYTSFLEVNEFFTCRDVDSEIVVLQIYDILGIEKRLISARIGKHMKDILCEVHGSQILCSHILLGVKLCHRFSILSLFTKEVDSFRLIEEKRRKTAKSSGRKPGQKNRKQKISDPFHLIN